MDKRKQQAINIALLRCLIRSSKAGILLTQSLNAPESERSEIAKLYAQENELFLAALDKCLELIDGAGDEL